MINCYLLKVIWAVFCWALLHLDRWNYIHLPSPLAIGKINEMLVSLPPTFSWGKCWQPRINVAIDLPVISKGTRQVLPLLAGEMGRQQPLATLWVWLTGLRCLDWLGRLRQRGRFSWDLQPGDWPTLVLKSQSHGHSQVLQPWQAVGLSRSVISSTQWGWRSLPWWLGEYEEMCFVNIFYLSTKVNVMFLSEKPTKFTDIKTEA